ncbi:hypothetical protein R6Q59_028835 [Mikania micrantha]
MMIAYQSEEYPSMEEVSANSKHLTNYEDIENNLQEKTEVDSENGFREGKKDFVAPAIGKMTFIPPGTHSVYLKHANFLE